MQDVIMSCHDVTRFADSRSFSVQVKTTGEGHIVVLQTAITFTQCASHFLFISTLCWVTCIKRINVFRIMTIVESGLLQKWMKRHRPIDKCDKSLSSISRRQTQIQDTQGAYTTLSLRLADAILVFVLEIIVNKLLNKKKRAKIY